MFTKISNKIRQRAMTLAEVTIAIGVGSIVLLSLGSFAIYSGRSMAGVFNYTEMDYGSRQALDQMTRDIRECTRLKEYSTNRLVLVDFDGADLAFVYSPQTKTLVRSKGGEEKTLLNGCEWLLFSIYKQNPVSGSYNLTPATNAAKAKVIGISWNCTRNVLGTINSEPMQEALIVVRKN